MSIYDENSGILYIVSFVVLECFVCVIYFWGLCKGKGILWFGCYFSLEMEFIILDLVFECKFDIGRWDFFFLFFSCFFVCKRFFWGFGDWIMFLNFCLFVYFFFRDGEKELMMSVGCVVFCRIELYCCLNKFCGIIYFWVFMYFERF